MHRENRRLAAIVCADIAGFSRLVGQDEEGTLRSLRNHRNELIDRSIEAHGGRIANTAGDSLLLEFPSVVDAVRCVLEVQRGMSDRNQTVPPNQRIEFRTGINLGDVIAEGDDLLGDGVNVAARLQELSDAGGVILSSAAYEQIRDRLEITTEDMGEVAVKNIARPVRVFRIASDLPHKGIRLSRKIWRFHLAIGATITTALILGIVGNVVYRWQWAEPIEKSSPIFSHKPSIAILPFTNISGNPKDDYFADGITDDLITDLSKVSGLFVIARNSVFAYKDKIIRIQDIARELQVRYVLEGSVRKSSDKIRINAKLVEAASGRNLWAERYDRNYTDVLMVQDEVLDRIVSALSIRLTKDEETNLTRAPTRDLKAYDNYLRALKYYHAGDGNGLRNSLHASTNAVERDPNFAKAYALFARAAIDVWRLDLVGVMPGPMARKKATEAAKKALSLDPTLADALSVGALLKMVEGEHLKAVDAARQAVYTAPNNANAYLTLAIVLGYAGRHAEALNAANVALRLDPKPSQNLLRYYGWVMVMNHNYERAIEILQSIPKTARGIFAIGDSPGEILAIAYIRSGKKAEAQNIVRGMIRRNTFLNLSYLKSLYSHHKRKEDLEFRLNALRQAGLPEWPFDYKGKAENRLNGRQIIELSKKGTWTGWDMSRGLGFVREANADGAIIYANKETLMSGSAQVKDGQLCEAYEIFLLGRQQCGYVYRNPTGTQESHNEYTYVNPVTVTIFSTER